MSSQTGGRGNGGRPRYRFRSIRLLVPLPSGASSPAMLAQPEHPLALRRLIRWNTPSCTCKTPWEEAPIQKQQEQDSCRRNCRISREPYGSASNQKGQQNRIFRTNLHRHQGISPRRAQPTRILKEDRGFLRLLNRRLRVALAPEARSILSALTTGGGAGVGRRDLGLWAAPLGLGWRAGRKPALLKNERRLDRRLGGRSSGPGMDVRENSGVKRNSWAFF